MEPGKVEGVVHGLEMEALAAASSPADVAAMLGALPAEYAAWIDHKPRPTWSPISGTCSRACSTPRGRSSGGWPTVWRRSTTPTSFSRSGRRLAGTRSLSLLELAPAHGAHLLMPRLGEPVEPSRAERVTPWWRAAPQGGERPTLSDEEPLSLPPATEGDAAVLWPMD